MKKKCNLYIMQYNKLKKKKNTYFSMASDDSEPFYTGMCYTYFK